jgi:hypothetical protein
MARYDGAIHFECQTNGPVVQIAIFAAGLPGDLISAGHFPAAQAREFAATLAGLADMIDAREGAGQGEPARRAVNVILPTLDLSQGQANFRDPRVVYGLPGEGKA